tara:strand:+ start:785 stop:1954 length:1170 start_codon:yes stop_codon:yes gene_type:complete
MADQFLFNRDTKFYIERGSDIWEIPILDGFSFSQAQNISEITLNEASSSGTSRRGRQAFVDSLAPVEFSFSTYMRPIVATNGATGGWEGSGSENRHHAIEEPLWAMLVNAGAFTASDGATEAAWADGISTSTSALTIDFTGSEKPNMTNSFSVYFVLGGATDTAGKAQQYQLTNAVINEATIDFDIEGIATIQWSGFADKIIDGGAALITPTITEDITDTSNFIRNKLTTLALTNSNSLSSGTHNVVLTGGSITIANNITYLTPETLGTINRPLGDVNGTRSVTGNFTCYLNTETAASADLFEDILESNNGTGTDVVTNDFNLVLSIGGASAPKVVFTMAQCHLEIPTHSFDDITSIDVAFHALPANLNPGSTAASYEITSIVYTGTVA